MSMDIKNVDNIILQHFQSLGWESEDITNSLKDLDVTDVAKLLIKCVNVINPQSDLPSILPQNMAQRFRTAANIANVIKDLGYHGDLGYQTILYPNEVDLRKLFMFLIEKMPKDSPTILMGSQDHRDLIQVDAKKKILVSLQSPWIPPHCHAMAKKYRLKEGKEVPLTQWGISHCKQFSAEKLTGESSLGMKVPLRPCGDKLCSTLLDLHSETLGQDLILNKEPTSRMVEANNVGATSEKTSSQPYPKLIPIHKSCVHSVLQDLNIETSSSSETSSKLCLVGLNHVEDREGEAKLTGLTNCLLELQLKLEKTDDEVNDVNFSIKEVGPSIVYENRDVDSKFLNGNFGIRNFPSLLSFTSEKLFIDLASELQNEEIMIENQKKKLYALQKTSSLASDIDLNLGKLKDSLKASKEKDKKLLNQWLEFKTPLINELGELEIKCSQKKDKKKQIHEEIEQLKKQMKNLAIDSSRKETLYHQLKQQQEHLPKGVNRSVYTKQILDISAKVRVQRKEIEKVLSDTRVIQKEINTLTGKLQRTFAAVEDASFKVASSGEKARPIYRAVVAIHEEFGHVADIIRETGICQREIADIKEQTIAEKSKKVEESLQNLQEDYLRVKSENSTMKKRLSEKSS